LINRLTVSAMNTVVTVVGLQHKVINWHWHLTTNSLSYSNRKTGLLSSCQWKCSGSGFQQCLALFSARSSSC